MSIDDELSKLIQECKQARSDALKGLTNLKRRIGGAPGEDPESVIILKSKNEKEKDYLQRTIIMMELKQLAESITTIAFRKKLDKKGPLHFKNRPRLWQERIESGDQEEKFGKSKQPKKGRKPSQMYGQFSLD